MEVDTDVKIDGLEEFTNWVDSFCKSAGLTEPVYDDPMYAFILDLNYESLVALSAEECIAYAYILINYVSGIQKKLDKMIAQNNWCIEALNYLYSKYWDNYDKYLPSDLRRHSIIRENSYAQLVERQRLRLKGGIQMLEESCKDIRRKVELLQSLGKVRTYNK